MLVVLSLFLKYNFDQIHKESLLIKKTVENLPIALYTLMGYSIEFLFGKPLEFFVFK